VREVLHIARAARIPVHIAHIKALGTDVWGRSDSVIAIVNAARAEGLDVTADQYPYTASGSSVGASLLPRWAEAGGRDSLRARTADSTTRARLVADMTENLRRRGGAASLLITGGRDSTIRGRTLAQVAESRAKPPIEAAIEIILAGDASVASFNMQEADIEAFMKQPWVSTGSDGSGGHPRKYGTYPRKLRRYVYDKQVLTVEQAIEASSARAARQMGLADRGTIAVGKAADVIAFDPRTIADKATYEQATELAVGVRWVLVNGKVAVADGQPTGELAGRVLRKSPARAASR
jgi:N-acyl-D-amino-acid deacylase